MADRTVSVDLIGRDKSLSKSLDKAGGSATKMGKVMSGVGKVAGGVFKAGLGVAAAGVGIVGKFLVDGVKSAISYQTVLKKTAAVIKSTGNQAHTSVKGVKDLAASLETMSGIDEELIINSQNVLLTFTNIKNVGKDRIFDMATKSALDMSVALGSDLQGASIQLGKALNDPITGVGALSKVGVTFTEKQKKVIAALVKTGDTAGAQKVILKELAKEFGGAAKAAGSGFAGDLARLQDAISDTGRTIGQKILPKLTDLAQWLSKKIPDAITEFEDGWNGMTLKSEGLAGVAAELKDLNGALATAGQNFDANGQHAKTWSERLSSELNAVAALATDWVEVWNEAYTGVKVIWQKFNVAADKAALAMLKPFAKIPGKLGESFRRSSENIKKNLAEDQAVLDKMNTKHGQAEVNKLDTTIRRLKGKKVITEADKRNLARSIAQVNKLISRNAALHSKTVTIRMHYLLYQTGKGPGTQGQGLGVWKAKGGPVSKGQSYVVGDGGRPELFVPDESGTILPKVPSTTNRSAFGGGGGTINVYITHPLGTPEALVPAIVAGINAYKSGGKSIPRGTFTDAA